jgi:hypothetical protein
VGIANFGLASHLSGASFSPELHTDLMYLPQARSADWLTIGETAAIGINGQPARNLRYALRKPLFLLAVGTQSVLSHVHNLSPYLGILKLCDVDILGTH